MSVVLVTDTHLGLQKDNEIWHKVIIDLFDEIIDTCRKKNIKTVIHLGDFFHNRKAINTKSLAVAYSIAEATRDLNLKIIIGNHDMFYKSQIEPTTLEIFEEYSHIEIIKKPTIFENILMVPWLWDSIEDFDVPYLCGHFQIKGFLMNNYIKCKDGIDKGSLSKFKKVFSGHFHTPSIEGNITYLGSPFQQTFNDVGGERGFYILNDDLEFLPFSKAPKFVIIKTDSIENNDVLDNIKGNIIRLEFLEDYGTNENNKILELVQSHSPLQLYVDFSKAAIDNTEIKMEEAPALIDHKDIIREYIEKKKVPGNLKKRVILSIIFKMIEEGAE